MSLFASEAELHEWLRERLEEVSGISSLICNSEMLEAGVPMASYERAVFQSFAYALRSLHITEVISDDKNISRTPGEGLYPDFLLYAVETESIVIVELKNFDGPTRQAGTEVSAYAAEVRTYLPFIANGDVINVIVSTTWPTLLRHYVAHEIIWTGRKILCLEPVNLGGDVRLKVPDIMLFADTEAFGPISSKHVGGYQLCLYGRNQHNESQNLDAPHVSHMRTTLQAMGAKGNALGAHGFAFLWKDRWERSLAPYSITMINFAPFQGVGRFLISLPQGTEPTEIQTRFLDLVAEFNPAGHSQSLEEIQTVAQEFLATICNPQPEGFVSWHALRPIMMERGHLIAFSGWGFFGERYLDALRTEYGAGGTAPQLDDPLLGLRIVDEVVREDAPYVDTSYWRGEDDDEDETG